MAGFGIFLLVESRSFGFTGSANLIPIFVTIVGFLVLGIAFMGCCGAISLNRCLLLSFSIAIGIIIVAEIVGGVLLVIYRSKFKEGLGKYLKEAIRNVENATNPSAGKAFKKLQDKFECCGANGPEDWQNPSQGCCKSGESACENYPREGCIKVIHEWLKKNLLAVGTVILVLSVLEVGAITAACCLYRQLD
ncbi:unnamed protein product [Rodentolepis nana]|uniref:Tetraspanin n=1 Tax=Rodentolepis nana TaxID=102285 RepID=A0A0R3T0R5_RODNA|nr:unnamed protein product [Rodentolepis nana]